MQRFASIDDIKLRVAGIQKAELRALAQVGALNFISGAQKNIHRRDALWQVERASRRAGPLLERIEADPPNTAQVFESTGGEFAARPLLNSPLQQMTMEERLVADFDGTGLTVGPHPMAYHRAQLKTHGVLSAKELMAVQDGMHVRIAGAVIARQRPGTAKGFVFLSLEDETGIANAIITPQLFDQDRTVVVHHPYLLIEGKLQNQDNVISVKAERVAPLTVTRAEPGSHDFH